MSNRPRPVSSLPRPPTRLAPTSIIADTAVITGSQLITIGANVILHPRAKLISSHGPISIGTGCIISEKASLGLLEARAEEAEYGAPGNANAVELGQNVVLEPAAIVEAMSVGEGTTFEAGCKVGAGAVIGKYCRITPMCAIGPDETLPDFTIVWGNNQKRQIKPGLEGLRAKTHEKEIEVLRRLIPSNLAKWQTDA